MIKPKNLLTAFALRMLLVLIINGFAWTVIVQMYYQHKTTQQTLDAVQASLHSLEPAFREIASQEQPQLEEFLVKTMQERNIPFLQVFNTDEGMIFNKGSEMLPGKYRPNPPPLSQADTPEHQLIEIDNRHYLYLVTPVFHAGWYMRAVIPVNPEFINRIEGTTHTTISVVVLTLLQVTIVLFPMMIASYNRTLRDREDLLMSHLWTVLALGNAIAKRDSDTDIHNYRVSYYALRLAEAAGLEPARIPGLIKGAFLHDVGKIGVPDSVLLKPGKLSQEEYSIVQRHVTDGLEIIAGIPWLHDAAPVISGHHEHYNGDGYPNALKGSDIPLEARIFTVVDVFDALTSTRPYKKALSVENALNVMDESIGTHFDPKIYRIFKDLAPSLQKQLSQQSRRQIRRRLSHAILPYFPYTIDYGKHIAIHKKSH